MPDLQQAVPGKPPAALTAGPFDDIIDRIHLEAFREVDDRGTYFLEAVCLMAFFTLEVCMHVRDRAFILPFAYLIFD